MKSINAALRATIIAALTVFFLFPINYASAQGVIKVGAIVQLSGAASFLGPSEKDAYLMAAKEINKNGGVLGKHLKVIVADSATDPSTANTDAKRLLAQDQVSALFASTTSASRQSILPVVIRNRKTLFFYDAVYEGHACNRSMYVMGEVPHTQIAPIVPYLQKKLHKNKWYFVGDGYNWPRDTYKVAKKTIRKDGGKIVGSKFVPIGTTDFSTVLQNISSTKPNFVLLILLPSDAVAFMKQFNNQGLNKHIVPIATLVEQTALAAMGHASRNLLIPAGYFPNTTPQSKKFEKQYHQVMGRNAAPQNFISINGYDALRLWAMAVNKAGTLNMRSVSKALPTVTWHGPRGPVSWSAKTHHATFPIYLARVNAHGSPQVIHSFGPVSPGPQCHF